MSKKLPFSSYQTSSTLPKTNSSSFNSIVRPPNITSSEIMNIAAAAQNPFPLNTYQVSPAPPLSFSAIIEQDHTEINHAAGLLIKRATNPKTTPIELRNLLDYLVWRLVRHDVSEDIVMRPAFVSYLGYEGVDMTEHDRKDHEHAKVVLLRLYGMGLLDDEPPISASIKSNNPEISASTINQRRRNLQIFIATIVDLFRDLAEHMRVESGEQIPRLESMLRTEESQELAKRYIRTQQVLTPELKMRGRKVWGDVTEYANTTSEIFKRIFEEVEREMLGKAAKL